MKRLFLVALLIGSAANAQFTTPEQLGAAMTNFNNRWNSAALPASNNSYEMGRQRSLRHSIVKAIRRGDCKSAHELAIKTGYARVVEIVQSTCH